MDFCKAKSFLWPALSLKLLWFTFLAMRQMANPVALCKFCKKGPMQSIVKKDWTEITVTKVFQTLERAQNYIVAKILSLPCMGPPITVTSLFLYVPARRADGIPLLESFYRVWLLSWRRRRLCAAQGTCSSFDRMKMAESALLLSLCRFPSSH